MTEFVILGLTLGYFYTYISCDEKINSNKFNLYMFRLIGIALATMAISYFIVNCYRVLF